MAAAQVALSDIDIHGQPKWHYVSDDSRHGFCPDCGSQLFWRNDKNQYLSITAGSVENEEALTVAGHVFVGEKGRYYELGANEPRFLRWADCMEHN